MTFEEFYSLYKERETKYTKIMVESIYRLGPSTWCSDIKTKKLVRINWSETPIKFSEISLAEEMERRKQYQLLNKMFKAQEKLEQMNDDFQ
jgi:hypothetical protein